MGQTVLITGANRGIGLALAAELSGHGHLVVAGCRRPAEAADLNDLAQKNAGQIRVLELDVNSEDSVSAAAAQMGKEAEALDLLVNNAAVFPEEGNESIFDMDLQHFREAFETNVLGVVRMVRAFVPQLEKAETPRIVNISSGAGSIAGKDDFGYYAYAASKAALNMVTRALAAELHSRHICVVALTPGWVQTEMGGPNAPLKPEQSARAIAKTITGLSFQDTSRFIERTGSSVSYGW